MIDRRQYLKLTLATGAGLALGPLHVAADDTQVPIMRAIPGTGEQLPVVGLGSSATFAGVAGEKDTGSLLEVLQTLLQHGGAVFDTAPSYGESERIAGEIARTLGATQQIFWATKLNVAAPGGKADPRAARAQLETSLERIGKHPLDLVQVHNMGDPDTQLALLDEYKAAGRIRHIGITNTSAGQDGHLERVMRSRALDFIGIDYAIDNRRMEERIFPLACDRGIAVLVYAPFGRTRLWARVRGQALPEWAAEFDARSWAQFFLKFVIAHPAVTATTPATSKASHMLDNIGAMFGRLPDATMRKRMIAHVERIAG